MHPFEIYIKKKVTLGMCVKKDCLLLAYGNKRYQTNKSQDFSHLPNRNTAQYISSVLKYCSNLWKIWLWKVIYFLWKSVWTYLWVNFQNLCLEALASMSFFPTVNWRWHNKGVCILVLLLIMFELWVTQRLPEKTVLYFINIIILVYKKNKNKCWAWIIEGKHSHC